MASTLGILRRIAAFLPQNLQHSARRAWHSRQIRLGHFASDEPEFALLGQFVRPGDSVIDVGANVGHYTVRLSQLVGPQGRVIAFEPVPATFEVLATNVHAAGCENVTLFNTAASALTRMVSMTVPRFPDGLANYYQASIGTAVPGQSAIQALAIPIDALGIPHRISLIKIDAEGHELDVLKGLRQTLASHRPKVILEASGQASMDFLSGLDFRFTRLQNSPNVICIPAELAEESPLAAAGRKTANT
jgi:FkbM family methyltransferase